MANPPNTIDNVGRTLTAGHISAIQDRLLADGYVYLRGMPDEFDHFDEVRCLGELVKQYEGRLVREVRPDPKLAEAEISASNLKALSPHTESFEFEGPPPRYVVLWCVQQAAGSGGETTLADAREFVTEFSDPDIELMHTRHYEWRSPGSLKLEGISMAARHPILEQRPDGLLIRYSSREMYPIGADADDLATRYVQGGIKFFEATHTAITIVRNAMLIWDNWRIIHSRNAFSDPRRHLRRVLLNPRHGRPG